MENSTSPSGASSATSIDFSIAALSISVGDPLLRADTPADSPALARVVALAESFPGIQTRVHRIEGANRSLTEIYLLGPTNVVPAAPFEEHEIVEKVVRVTQKYRAIGRHDGQVGEASFEYNGVRFGQDTLVASPGACAVDTRENADQTFAALARPGPQTTRAGAYNRAPALRIPGLAPRASSGVRARRKHGIRVVAMRSRTRPTSTRSGAPSNNRAGDRRHAQSHRNAQTSSCQGGRATQSSRVFKRGMGITLEESLNACEYVAQSGNRRIVFCLRGMKSQLGDPHRNFIDFAHVPVLKRLTRMPVCIDPSHSVGRRAASPEGILDIFHATAQAVIAGANMILVDIHPHPEQALCDGPQALLLEELPWFLEDVAIARRAYLERQALAQRQSNAR